MASNRRKKDLVTLDGDAVTRRRMAMCMTRQELAAKSHCSPRTIWNCHNDVAVTLTKARQIAAALRMSLGSLVVRRSADARAGSGAAVEDTGRGPATVGAA